MGVKGLTRLLQKLAPQAVNLHQISHYKGKTLAVDVSCFLHRFIYGADPHPARVQRGVYRLCAYLHFHEITPIFVFDGPGRIIEKEREILRRKAMKEKAKKAFHLEKVRKARLRDLKGSTELLQTVSPERASMILYDIRSQDHDALSLKPSKLPEAAESGPISVHDELLTIIGLDLLEDMDIHHQNENIGDDTFWTAPSIPEDMHQQLEDHLEFTRGFYREASFLTEPTDFDVVGNDTDTFEYDLDTLDRMELDIETVANLDLIQDLSDKRDDDTNGHLPLALRTGTSIRVPILVQPELMEVDALSDTEYDAKIREKVHAALVKFVQSVEGNIEVGIAALAENATQKQKALSTLEEKLVQEIKETYRTKGSHNDQELLTLSMRIDASGPIEQVSQPLVVQPSDDDQYPPTSPPSIAELPTNSEEQATISEEQATISEEQATISEEQATISIQPLLPILQTEGDDTETIFVDDDIAGKVDGIQMGEKPFEDDVIVTTVEAEQDEPGTDAAIDTEEDGDLKSMIHGVLTAHQSIFHTLERRTMRVTRELALSCQSLLKAMGQPVIEARDAEAEAVCARLTTLGITYASVSEDTDTAVFGNGLVLRQVGASSGKDIIEINPLVAHSALGMNRDAFRDMSILCGTDFSGTIEGIGPHRAVKLIQYYGSIEAIMANTDNKPRDDFLYDRARRVFDRTPVVPLDRSAYQSKPEVQPLLQELMQKYEIDPEEVTNDIRNESGFGDIQNGFGGEGTTTSMGEDPFKASVISIPDLDGESLYDNKV
ncbi:Elongation of fatty acids protein 2 [Mortierella polycephala]|uniref:Elongation of fatty acids protein 2 n=1 Tax=Mortierella polycephala TaxID=41804 RepID=A0A9P6U8P9_9FUNG|nr:Elongation of fatty acids protein 2 [Mortierella polycephala]